MMKLKIGDTYDDGYNLGTIVGLSVVFTDIPQQKNWILVCGSSILKRYHENTPVTWGEVHSAVKNEMESQIDKQLARYELCPLGMFDPQMKVKWIEVKEELIFNELGYIIENINKELTE